MQNSSTVNIKPIGRVGVANLVNDVNDNLENTKYYADILMRQRVAKKNPCFKKLVKIKTIVEIHYCQ